MKFEFQALSENIKSFGHWTIKIIDHLETKLNFSFYQSDNKVLK